MQYLLDTNVVIDILHNDQKVASRYQIESVKGNEIVICPVVYYEVVRGFKIVDATRKFANFLRLYQNWQILPFDMAATEKAIEIYVQLHKGQVIEDNDIYIAAVAMANDCTLVTANTKHFGRIENLKIVNWRE